jgi:hypothetical protein
MDRDAVLGAFNEQVRRHPAAQAGIRHDGTVTWSQEANGGSWSGVIWSDLDAGNADAVIAVQIARFADSAQPWEWKYYSYDKPADLPNRLQRMGFTREPDEALLIAEVAQLDLQVPPPDGVRLHDIVDAAGIEAVVRVHDEVFGGVNTHLGRDLTEGLSQRPTTVAAVLALAGQTPIAAGRVELGPGTEFAGLWGGGTVAAWRHRGVFRSLVSHRAALAAARGYRYLQVDASPDSRPILTALGFVELATTTPFTYSPQSPHLT